MCLESQWVRALWTGTGVMMGVVVAPCVMLAFVGGRTVHCRGAVVLLVWVIKELR